MSVIQCGTTLGVETTSSVNFNRKDRMPLITGILAAATLAAHATAAPTPVLIGRGDSLEEWAGQGSQTSLTVSSSTVPWSGLPFLNFSYDFGSGGWQTTFGPVDASTSVKTIPQQLNLTFAVYLPADSPAGTCVNVGVTGADGSSFGSCSSLASGWQSLSIALVTQSFWSNGNNLSLPIKGLSLGVSNHRAPGPGPAGWLGFADVAIVSAAQPGQIPAPVYHLLVQPLPATSGVLVAGSGAPPTKVGALVINRLPVACNATVIVEARNATGPMGEGDDGFGSWNVCAETGGVALDPWESVTLLCSVPSGTAGWLTMRSTFSASSCWTVNDTGPQARAGKCRLSGVYLMFVTPIRCTGHRGRRRSGSSTASHYCADAQRQSWRVWRPDVPECGVCCAHRHAHYALRATLGVGAAERVLERDDLLRVVTLRQYL